MRNTIKNILRKCTREYPLNVLCAPTHERYQSGWSDLPVNFYMFRGPHIKDWDDTYAKLPKNHFLLDKWDGNPKTILKNIPDYVDFDLVLSQSKTGQFQALSTCADILHLPLLSLEHTLPMPNWDEEILQMYNSKRGDVNVFISQYSVDSWKWEKQTESPYHVIHHGINTDLFCDIGMERKQVLLSVVNDWKNRDWCCGYKLWERVTQGLPVQPVGDTPGLSKPADSIEHLVELYNTHSIFLNTSLVSPVPSALLESMACIPEGEYVFFNHQCAKIEDIINLQTFNENTKGDKIYKKHIVDYTGELVSIKCNHIPKFRVTEDHKIAVVNITEVYDKELRKQNKKPYHKIISDIIWKPANQIQTKNDWLVVPKFKTEIPTKLSKEWLRFYGLFMAEGSTNGGYIQLTFHCDEIEYINEIKEFAKQLGKNVHTRNVKNAKCTQVIFYHSELALQLRNMFGERADLKRVPDEIMQSSKEETKIFFNAYMDGDGHKIDKNSSSFVTSSQSLARQLFLLCTKLDLLPNFASMSGKKGSIRGREFIGKPQCLVSFVKRHANSCKVYLEDNDNFYVRVKEITKIGYCGKVYNLTTASNSFTNPFALIHNCGCVPVSTATCMIPEIIEHGVNGFISNSPHNLRDYCKKLLDNPSLCKQMGEKARQTIIDKFGMDTFKKSWMDVFNLTADTVYKGN